MPPLSHSLRLRLRLRPRPCGSTGTGTSTRPLLLLLLFALSRHMGSLSGKRNSAGLIPRTRNPSLWTAGISSSSSSTSCTTRQDYRREVDTVEEDKGERKEEREGESNGEEERNGKGKGKGKGQRTLPALFVRSGTSTGLVLKASDLPGPSFSSSSIPPSGSSSSSGSGSGSGLISSGTEEWTEQWKDILPAAMGSPDPVHGRQLDGMGGGVSSTSKICVLAPSYSSSSSASASENRRDSSRVGMGMERTKLDDGEEDADVDFTFVQVGIRDGALDLAGNCGNMSAVVGPLAWDWGFVSEEEKRARIVTRIVDEEGEEKGEKTKVMEAMVKVFNTNTRKLIHPRFRVSGDPPVYDPTGNYAMDGVPGTGSRITLSFIDPAGAKTGRALPTGNPVDTLFLPDGTRVRASLVDVSNPGVFVTLEDLGVCLGRQNFLHDVNNHFTPATVEEDEELKGKLEMIRREGAKMMGLDPDVQSVPKIVLLFPPPESGGSDDDVGKEAGNYFENDYDLRCLAMSMGQAHKAVPLTLSLCLGAAANIEGTVAAMVCRKRSKDQTNSNNKNNNNNSKSKNSHSGGGEAQQTESRSVVIAHPSGTVEIGATFRDGHIVSADLHRTARVLMKGEVYY